MSVHALFVIVCLIGAVALAALVAYLVWLWRGDRDPEPFRAETRQAFASLRAARTPAPAAPRPAPVRPALYVPLEGIDPVGYWSAVARHTAAQRRRLQRIAAADAAWIRAVAVFRPATRSWGRPGATRAALAPAKDKTGIVLRDTDSCWTGLDVKALKAMLLAEAEAGFAAADAAWRACMPAVTR